MANGRNPGKRDTGRDPGSFVAIPWSVLDSAAYMGLSPTAKALLMEVARQYHRDDNGRMLLSRAYLATRGWFSAGAIQKAKAELIAAGLIFETVKGCRPNKASWYACTWRHLDKILGYDMDAEKAFERGAYRKTLPKEKRPPPAAPANAKRRKNAALIPVAGTGKASIVPVAGTEKAATVPVAGAIRPIIHPPSVPVAGHPLEIAISGVRTETGPGDDDHGAKPASTSKGAKAGARSENAPGRPDATRPTPAICQHEGCRTLTMGREFCAKHQHLGRARAHTGGVLCAPHEPDELRPS